MGSLSTRPKAGDILNAPAEAISIEGPKDLYFSIGGFRIF